MTSGLQTRPRGGKNFKVASPLVECGFSKTDIRSLASSLGLSNAQKPQAACLSADFLRTEITVELLRRVEAAEEVLQNQGFTQFRVRHHGDLATGNIDLIIPKMFQNFTEVEKEIKGAGYKHVTLDLAGFVRAPSTRDLTSQRSISKT